MLALMTTPFTPDQLIALATRLRVWALAFVAWLAEVLPCRALRESVARDLAAAERGLMGVIVLMALQRVDWPPETTLRRLSRPLSVPPGCALRAARGSEMRRMTRGLWPTARGLMARTQRVLRVLARLEFYVARLVRRLMRFAPELRLVAAAPTPAPAPAGRAVAPAGVDSS